MADVKPICCDTSFLFSFYGQDAHSTRAEAIAEQLAAPLSITLFNEYEFPNAVHLAVFRRALSTKDAGAMLEDFQEDVVAGKLIRPACDPANVLIEAKRLSTTRTPISGCRAFDVLHVAAALCLEAGDFLSFDTNQRSLASVEGLSVNVFEKLFG